MMKIKYLYLIAILIVTAFIAFIACKKSEDTPDPPSPPVENCEIISPSDSIIIQTGTIVSIEAAVSGFSESVKVAFSIDTLPTLESAEAPYIFKWGTEGWGPGFYTVRADAYEGLDLASDQITIELIDTIGPPVAPVPLITIIPDKGTIDTIFTFDTSESYDENEDIDKLLFRWDFEGDGEWDTDFSHTLIYQHKYHYVGHYHVVLEVMDTDNMIADTVESLLVSYAPFTDPCEGAMSIPYGGKVYHTLPIGDQCWLRENLDIGLMITGGEEQTNNQVIEKYCYDDDSLNCEKYGGLYMWKEMMNYFPIQGGRGICPVGYHIPSDDEWKELEGFTDSQFGIGDPEWDIINAFRGFDSGRHLKARLGWISGGNGENTYGFKALASGFWESGSSFVRAGEEAHIWGSSHDNGHNGIKREFKYDEDGVSRSYHWDEAAFSVRCIRD